MATSYKTPGVYIEEIVKFPPSVAQVETAIPAFIGNTELLKEDAEKLVPKRIISMVEYENYFGISKLESFEVKVTVTKQNSIITNIETVLNTGVPTNDKLIPKNLMYYALQLYFANGGGPCYIVSTGIQADNGAVVKVDIKKGVEALEEYDEITLFISPDATKLSAADYKANFSDPVLKQCLKLHDRFGVFDVVDAHTKTTAATKITDFRTNSSSIKNEIKYGAAYFPYIKTTFNFLTEDAKITVKEHKEIIDGAAETDGSLKNKKLNDVLFNSNNLIYNSVKDYLNTLYAVMPPAPAVVGLYAQVDNTLGVWHAPANVSLSNVIAPAFPITQDLNDGLNVDSGSGKSINAIRAFTGKGTLIWGARTLAGNDNEWRYISVRRFFNMVEESVKKATEQFVFEPNDANTWIKVRAMIENFLTLQWRAGALAGAKPEQAFYVRVALGETMTALDILEGRMNVEIGMAVVRPAEFIILKFSHKMQEA